LLLSVCRQQLSSLDHPANQYSETDAYCKRRHNCFNGVALEPLSGIVNKLFRGITALLCDTPRCSHAILKCIRERGCRTRSLSRRFGDLITRSFQD
jgi:hypothetical protein